LIGIPAIGRRSSGTGGGSPSSGRPAPLKILPIRSSETPSRASRSTSEIEVLTTSNPMVSSNT
jgi:hypothetical protein